VEDLIDPLPTDDDGSGESPAGDGGDAGAGDSAPGPGDEPGDAGAPGNEDDDAAGDGGESGDDGNDDAAAGADGDGDGQPGGDDAPAGGAGDDPAAGAAGSDGRPLKRIHIATLPRRERLIVEYLARNRSAGATTEDAIAFVDSKHPELAPPRKQGGDSQGEDPEAALLAEITRIKGAMEKASDDVDLKAHGKLVEEMMDKRDELAQLRARRQSAQSDASRARESTEAISKREAVRQFPQAGREGSALHTAVQDEIGRLEAVNPAAFDDPEWPEAVTAKVAARLGIASVSKTAAGPGPKPGSPRTIAPRTTGPVPARRTATPASATQPRPEQVKAALATAGTRDLDAFLRTHGRRTVSA
jgi:hypothetical protein